MESHRAGPVANLATSLPTDTHAHTPIRGTFDGVKLDSFDQAMTHALNETDKDVKLEAEGAHPLPGSIDTPVHIPFFNHFHSSNVRGSIGDQPLINPSADHEHPFGPDLVPNGSSVYDESDIQYANDPQSVFAQYNAQLETMTLDDPFTEDGTQTHTQFTEEEAERREPMKAYAKLCLPDGDFFVTSRQVIVGRDLEFWRQYTREKKHADRAQKALDEYALEPSQPSQPDDGDVHRGPSSRSSQSLVGRPAKALPSNFSEQGGAVFYPAFSEDDEEDPRRARRRRKTMKSNASSISVAPAVLHPSMSAELGMSASQGTDSVAPDESSAPQMVYIHPSNPRDIRLISKEHLLFEYNADEEKWELTILGNRAFVNNELYQKNARVTLSHEDEIIVTSVSIYFKLPDHRNSPDPSSASSALSDPAEEVYDDDFDVLSDETPSRRRSDVLGDTLSDSDDEGTTAEKAVNKKLKLKLNFKKKVTGGTDGLPENGKQSRPAQGDVNKPEDEVALIENSPEATKRADKGKRPKDPAPVSMEESDTSIPEFSLQSAEGVDLTKIHEALRDNEVSPAMPPPAQPVIEPGSIFEGVAAEELPQKRKGPGRPPKNGLISKRDQSFVKRKLKEYEKRGQPPPPMDELVSIVRAENKAKELAAKAAARGEAPPESSIMPSIELDPALASLPRPEAGPMTDSGVKTSATPIEPIRKPSPKPKRVVKSPSPMKPESDYTEEDLKKPTVTYVHILDEVLKDHPTGKADLQEIYDRICKRYPYFKYRVSTAGWQSSVRHNLLQHDRFVENGRSGKGRLWTINYDCPIDKEKKRRVTPPPRAPMAPMNGGFGPQFGQANYGNTYGQPNGQPSFHGAAQQGTSTYYSPYAPPQPGQSGALNQPRPPNGMNPGQHVPGGHPQQPFANQQIHGSQHAPPPPRAPSNPPQFQGIVDEIMKYRSRYLSQFQPDSDSFREHDELFRNCTTNISNEFHGTAAIKVEGANKTDEERRVDAELEKIFSRYQHLRGPPISASPTGANGSATPQPATVNVNNNENPSHATLVQSAAVAQPQAVVHASNGNIAHGGNPQQGPSTNSNATPVPGNTPQFQNGQRAPQAIGSSQSAMSSHQMPQSGTVRHDKQPFTTSGTAIMVTPDKAAPMVQQTASSRPAGLSQPTQGQKPNLGATGEGTSTQPDVVMASGDVVASATPQTPKHFSSDQRLNSIDTAIGPSSNGQTIASSQNTLANHAPQSAAGLRDHQIGATPQSQSGTIALPSKIANGLSVTQPAEAMLTKPGTTLQTLSGTTPSNTIMNGTPGLPINSAEQPIVIPDNPEHEAVLETKSVSNVTTKEPIVGTKRLADDAGRPGDDEVKRPKMTST